jgi:hypothetical protein
MIKSMLRRIPGDIATQVYPILFQFLPPAAFDEVEGLATEIFGTIRR